MKKKLMNYLTETEHGQEAIRQGQQQTEDHGKVIFASVLFFLGGGGGGGGGR